jgi:DNA-binding response OmpR family regulator
MKLLLVEDDPTMQTTLQRTLGRRRIDVRVCGDGALALVQWQALEPDVVALDLNLPNLDGLQVLAQARLELVQIEGLGQVVVGAGVESDDAVAHRAARRQQ